MRFFFVLIISFSLLFSDGFENVSLSDLVKNVSIASNKNIIFDEDINASNVSFFINDTSSINSFSALNTILHKKNLTLVKKKNYYFMTSYNSLKDYSLKIYNDVFTDIKSYLDYKAFKYVYLKQSNILHVTCSYSDFKDIKKSISAFNKKNNLVTLKFIIFSYSDNDLKDIGVNVSDMNIKNILNSIFSVSFNGGIVLKSTDFFNTVNFLQSKGKLNLVQYPYIITKNNSKFIFKSVDSVPILNTTISTSSTTNQNQTSYTYRDIGLTVNGFVNTYKKFNSLDLNITIDNIVSYNKDGLPLVSSKQFNTLTSCKNNDIILLTGLKQKKDSINDYSLPYISNIPFIGGIFKYKNTEHSINNFSIAIQVIRSNSGFADAILPPSEARTSGKER